MLYYNEKKSHFEFSSETDKIIPAFINMQSKLVFAQKTTVNTFFKSKYADLTEVMAVLKQPLVENKLGIMQFPVVQEFVDVPMKTKEFRKIGNYDKLVWTGKYDLVKVREILVVTLLVHESGQYVKTWYLGTPSDNDEQSRGITITYSRRYALMALFGIAPEDEDGNHVPNKKKQEDLEEPISFNLETQNIKSKKKYLKDKNNVPRYNITDDSLNDIFQKEKGLITTEQWREIKILINKKLGGNEKQFHAWFKDCYEMKFYDMPINAFAGVIKTINDQPEVIMNNIEEPKKEEDMGF